MDKLTKKERSANMSKIRSKNTKPELFVRKYIFAQGVRYRCNVLDLPGKPDIANKRCRLALDVHGCFWHGHKNCKYFRFPKTNQQFWKQKISKNIIRDEATRNALLELGFNYTVIWECEVKSGALSKLDTFISVYHDKKQGMDEGR